MNQIKSAVIVVDIDIDELTDEQVHDRLDTISSAIRRMDGVLGTCNEYDMTVVEEDDAM